MRSVSFLLLWICFFCIPCPAQQLEGGVNVKSFGAVGDGKTDDTAAINAACTAAKATAKTRIYFPSTTASYLISNTLHMDGCRMAGDYTLLSYPTGTGSRIVFSPTATPTTMVDMDTTEKGQLLQNAIQGLYIDCNGRAKTGVLLTAVNGHFSDTTIHGCTESGLVVDGAQNSVFDNLEVSGSAVNMRVVNGTSSCRFSRVEHALAKVAHLRMGLDSSLPGYGRRGALGVPVNGANMFGPSNIYSDGGNYQYALDIDHSVNNVWFNNVITPSSPFLLVLIRIGPTGYGNRFNDNFMTMGQMDAPVFLNSMPSTYVRGGSIQMLVKCQHHPITITGGNMFFYAVHYNDACLLDVANTTSQPTARVLQWDDGTRGGPASITPGAPHGTAGSTFFDSLTHQLRVWDNDRYVDTNGNPPGQCREWRGHGSPNGVVAGSICDRYINLDGPVNGAVLEYTKESGAGGSNRGWVGQSHGYYREAVLPSDVKLQTALTTLAGLSLTLETNGVYEVSVFIDVSCAAGDHCIFQPNASPTRTMHWQSAGGTGRTTLSQQFSYTKNPGAPGMITVSGQAESASAGRSTVYATTTHIAARLLYAF